MTARQGAEPASDEFRAKRRGREAALQMLYFCEVGHASADEAIAAHGENELATRLESPQARQFAACLVTGTVSHAEDLDPVVAASAEHWRPERMAIIDRLILRMAVYQLRYMPDVPPSVVINEAIELARRFGGEESGRFVNGVLDAVKRKLEAAAGPQ
jgi:N utilization substance protein B